VFTVAFGTAPTVANLQDVTDGYIQWELHGGPSSEGYRSRRSVDHALVELSAYSIDPLSLATLKRTDAFIPGLISADTAEMLPTSVAPIVRWRFLSDYGVTAGRSYLPGLTTDAMDTHDMERLNSAARLQLGLICADLPKQLLSASGGVLVHLRTRKQRTQLIPAPQYAIVDASMDAILAGTQRRRSRPLTGPGT
jgi:hypothetical protein